MTTAGATAAVAEGRLAAEALMADACVITRSGGTRVLDEVTGAYVTAPGAEVYRGRCRVKPRDNADRVVEAGGQAVSLWPVQVSIPVTVVDVRVDDVVTIGPSALDPALAGQRFRVRQVPTGSHLTARRLGCEVDGG